MLKISGYLNHQKKVCSFKYSIPLQLNDGSQKTQQTIVEVLENQEKRARASEFESWVGLPFSPPNPTRKQPSNI